MNVFKWLFITTYVLAGYYVGGTFHDKYRESCFKNYYTRTIIVALVWPVLIFDGGNNVVNYCKTEEKKG